jgi:hypothetical protein
VKTARRYRTNKIQLERRLFAADTTKSGGCWSRSQSWQAG